MKIFWSIRKKTIIPVFLSFIISGILIVVFLHTELSKLRMGYVQNIALLKQNEISRAVTRSAQDALEKAAVFTELPCVIEAYQLANSGNINDERDSMAQKARELLRKSLKSNMAGFEHLTGEKMQLHFHLKNGRSLVRLWRNKQIQKEGEWVDISDDISGFRPTVMDVNKTGKAVKGIEVGQGGFVVRGVAPILSSELGQLGSVEMLADYDNIIAAATGENQRILLYMNKDLLPFAGKLHDEKKYPIVNDKYVLASGATDDKFHQAIRSQFLDNGTATLTVSTVKNFTVSAFPVQDYRGKQVGIILFAMKTTIIDNAIKKVFLTIGVITLLAAVLITLGNNYLIGKTVIDPIHKTTGMLKEISEGNGDLAKRLKVSTHDEIAEMSHYFNVFIAKLQSLVGTIIGNANTVASAATQLSATTTDIATYSKDMNTQAITVASVTDNATQNTNVIAASAEEMSASTNTIAAAIEEMGASINDVARNCQIESSIASDANHHAQNSKEIIIKLSANCKVVSNVVELINTITKKINLLALNAQIEAARAGKAGTGFNVVANEVKELAKQTAEATDEIEKQVSEMQTNSEAAVQAIAVVSDVIDQVSTTSQTIVEAVGQQSVTINEIAKNLGYLKNGVQDVASNVAASAQRLTDASSAINNVKSAVSDSSRGVLQIEASTRDLSMLAENLNKLLKGFSI